MEFLSPQHARARDQQQSIWRNNLACARASQFYSRFLLRLFDLVVSSVNSACWDWNSTPHQRPRHPACVSALKEREDVSFLCVFRPKPDGDFSQRPNDKNESQKNLQIDHCEKMFQCWLASKSERIMNWDVVIGADWPFINRQKSIGSRLVFFLLSS